MTHHLLPVRHHGPGSARAVLAALDALSPDVVLIEGPPEADDLVPWVLDEELVPPVALLVYDVAEPARAARFPFAAFSPEWQAMCWAVSRDVPVRFMDLPVSVRFREESGPVLPVGAEETERVGLLARLAGYPDAATWWEHEVELRADATDVLAAVVEAMRALRASEEGPHGVRQPVPDDPATDPAALWNARREAWMRNQVRAEVGEDREVAVVCGAWHAPALLDLGGVTADREVLKGLRRAKTEATWIPWTHARLAQRSGYGAGVYSPGWYEAVWEGTTDLSERWLSRAARLLRDDGRHVAAADVISAVSLADTLAALRDRSRPGLAECREAIGSVLGRGAPGVLARVRDALEVGDALGQVPPTVPTVPLQQDVRAEQRRLRFRPAAEPREIDLDLRKASHYGRSVLLHRLRLLGVPWGEPRRGGDSDLGTFRERWTVAWDPEHDVRLVEASVWGNTLQEAASARARAAAAGEEALPRLVDWLDKALLADLPEAVDAVLDALSGPAVLAADLHHLMEALPPLARTARYGDVRGTPPERLGPVVEALVERVVVGLPPACRGIADDVAGATARRILDVDAALAQLGRDDLSADWVTALSRVAGQDGHGLLRGRAARLLVERGAWDEEALLGHARLALSPVAAPEQAVGWLEGLVRGSGLLLLHLDGLWEALDAWLAGLAPEAFATLLPLLRRAFADLEPAERRAMGSKAVGASPAAARAAAPADPQRAAKVWPVLRTVLGVE